MNLLKQLLVPIGCILIILSLWALSYFYTVHTSGIMINTIENELIPHIENAEWDAAFDSFDRFASDWENASCTYTLYMAPTAVTDIDLSLSRAHGYLETHDAPLTVGELTSIVSHLELILNDQLLSVDNIF